MLLLSLLALTKLVVLPARTLVSKFETQILEVAVDVGFLTPPNVRRSRHFAGIDKPWKPIPIGTSDEIIERHYSHHQVS